MRREILAQIAALARPLSHEAMQSYETCAVGEAIRAGLLPMSEAELRDYAMDFSQRIARYLGLPHRQSVDLFAAWTRDAQGTFEHGLRRTGRTVSDDIERLLAKTAMG